jgi:hypothetical protein
VWARTSPYEAGKFTSDDVFNPAVVDSQEGCAPLLAAMMALDSTILTDFNWDAPPAQPSLNGPNGVVYDFLWLQQTLNLLNANPQLHPDGGWGPKTQAALTNYQSVAGLPANGRYNVPTLTILVSAVAPQAPASQS